MSTGLVSPWLVDSCHLPASSRGLPWVPACVQMSSFFPLIFIYLAASGISWGMQDL